MASQILIVLILTFVINQKAISKSPVTGEHKTGF